MDEIYGRCAEGFPEPIGEYGPAHHRPVCQRVDGVSILWALENSVDRLGQVGVFQSE